MTKTNIKTVIAKIRILSELKDGAASRSHLNAVTRYIKAEYRTQAYKEMLTHGDIAEEVIETAKPGPNPTIVKITKLGRQHLEILRRSYKRNDYRSAGDK